MLIFFLVKIFPYFCNWKNKGKISILAGKNEKNIKIKMKSARKDCFQILRKAKFQLIGAIGILF